MIEESKSFLILGGSGMLGFELRRCLASQAIATYSSRPFPGGIHYRANVEGRFEQLLDELPSIPATLMLLIGQSSIDTCFHRPIEARLVNVSEITTVANIASRRGIPVVFISTDGVFDGSRSWWRDSDIPSPIIEYGKQKYEAEKIVLDAGDNLVIRIPKLIAELNHPQCFVSNWESNLMRGLRINCATDQRFNPISANEAAVAILALLARHSRGIVHLASYESCSRWELLKKFLEQINFDLMPYQPNIRTCELENLKLAESRPLNTSLYPSEVVAKLECRIRSPIEIINQRADILNRTLIETNI